MRDSGFASPYRFCKWRWVSLRGLLFTLVYNLVSNAIKYNRPAGRIDVLGRPGPGGTYVLEVRDTGTGIDREQLPRLFERFDKGPAANPDSA